MKKNIVALILLAFLLPSFVLASWWNPMSWFTTIPSVNPTENGALPETTGLMKSLDTISWKTYADPLETFYLKYPDTWTYKENDYGVNFKKPDSTEAFLKVSYAKDAQKIITQARELEKEQGVEYYFIEEVPIGTNVFTKMLLMEGLFSEYSDVSHSYLLPIASTTESGLSLIINPQKSSSKDSEVRLFLANITINPSKGEEAIKILEAREAKTRAISTVSNFRATAELYYDENKAGYANMCKNSEYFKKYLSTLSPQDYYCNSSPTAYVLSVKIPGGETMCIDNTYFSGVITPPAQTLSCKPPAPAESPLGSF